MSDFKWNADDADAVILQHQPRTAVYSSKTGNVIVRQETDAMQENDDLIYLTPQGALAIAWALIEEAHLVGLPSPSLSLMVQSEHWPPPKAAGEPGQSPEAGPLLEVMQREVAK